MLEDSRRSNESGSLLAEVLIGVVLIVTAVAPVATIVSTASQLRRAESERFLALLAAQNVLEELRAMPPAQLPSVHGNGFTVPGINGVGPGLQPRAADPDGLPGRIEVATIANDGAKTLYSVRVVVQWSGEQKRSELALATRIVQP